jgi:serine protease Do
VSNANFAVPGILDGGRPLIQHTASIDPGSSGGPLTTEDGHLLGLNVALLRSRQNVNLSVPVESVVESVHLAAVIRALRTSPELMTGALNETCGRLAGELSSSARPTNQLAHYVSNELVAREGYSSVSGLLRVTRSAKVANLFLDEPMQIMRATVGLRLSLTGDAMGTVGTAACTPVNPADARYVGTGRPIRMGIRSAKGLIELSWVFEHGHWRIVAGALADLNQMADVNEEAQKNAAAERTSAKGKASKRPK